MKKNERELLVLATINFVALSIFFILYVLRWLDYLNYLEKIGVNNTSMFQNHNFSALPFAPTFKYFLLAPIFLWEAIVFGYKYKSILISILCILLSVWLITFPLQMYYSILSFRFVLITGIFLESMAILLFLLIYLKLKLFDSRA